MSVIESYEGDFRDLVTRINKKCAAIPDLTGGGKKDEIAKTQNEIEEANDLIEQIEMEVIGLPSADRSAAKSRLGSYKKEVKDLEKALRKASVQLSSSQSARDDLFDFEGGDDARDALLGNTERLDRTSKRLDNGHRAALDAVDVGAGALAELQSQRETIDRSRGRLKGIDTDLFSSNRVLGRMIARAYRNRVATFIIIGVLLLTIVMIIILIVTG